MTTNLNTTTEQPFPIVWDNNRISIYQFLLPYQNADKLPEIAETLPDDESLDNNEFKWADGAMDGVINHHGASTEQNCVENMLMLLQQITIQPNQSDIEQLYNLVTTERTLSFIDDLAEAIPNIDVDFDKLYEFIYWLAINSPDREIIKFSIAILGSFTTEQTELFMLFGMHNEFSLYSAIALENTLSSENDIENTLMKLAQKVDGWGRIQIVERLTNYPLSSASKDWLLRAGYQNSIMNEYLAYTCAVAGELDKVLEQESIDNELISSIGEILEALINGGPAEDIYCYDVAAQVCANYLTHLLKQPNLVDLNILRAVKLIHNFVAEEVDENTPNWHEQIKDEIIEKANQFIQQDKWLELIEENLTANNENQFSLAAELYSQYGFDAWPARFEYQKKYNGDQWNDLMQSDSISRIQQVIQLANQQYDFAKLATGPTLDDGFGEDDAHYILLLILQELDRFPEVGEDLLLIALKSPLMRHRTMALNAIKAWDRSLWSDNIKTAIQELAIIEPDDEIKEDLAALIAEMND